MLYYIIWCIVNINIAVNLYRITNLTIAIVIFIFTGLISWLILSTAKDYTSMTLDLGGYLENYQDETYYLSPVRLNTEVYITMICDSDDEPYAYRFIYNLPRGKKKRVIVGNDRLDVVPIESNEKPYVVVHNFGLSNSIIDWLLDPAEPNYTLYLPKGEEEG